MTRAPEVAEPAPAPPPVPAPAPEPAPPPEPAPAPEPVPQPEPEPVPIPEPEPAPPPPAERVAPEPVPQPEPEAQVAPERQEAVTPDNSGTEAVPAEEATAPEAATTRIITEATETDPERQAPDLIASPRPSARPDRPRPVPVEAPPTPEAPPETPAATAPDPVADAVAAAVAEAAETPSAVSRPDVPVGPPLTASERDGLRVAVQQCWNVGSLSSDALRTTVTVAVEMEQSGRPVINSIRMIGSEGGSDAAARQAFETARRAIIRCGSAGFDLPVEKYAQWRDIEMTFNPERMRIR